jgi:adenylate cyclase
MEIRTETLAHVRIPPEALWPLIADTERLNRALGLLPVRYRSAASAEQPALEGEFRWHGLSLARWTEYPFDWEAPYRYAVRRTYHSGPFRALQFSVVLLPADGGSTVQVALAIAPRHAMGALLARALAPRMARRIARQASVFEQYYRGEQATPFPQLVPGAVDTRRLDALAEALVRAGRDPALVDRLRRHLREAPDVDVRGMRPFELADRWGSDRRAVLGLCLHATQLGLLELSWTVLCPNCRVAQARYLTLRALEGQAHCEVCQIRYDVDFDRLVEVRFDPAPGVRAVANEVFCIGGPLNTPHVLAQATVPPQAQRTLRLRVASAPLRLRVLQGPEATLQVEDGAPAQALLVLTDEGLVPAQGAIGPGEVAIAFRNARQMPTVVRLERAAWSEAAATGALVSTLPEFRSVFSAEVLAPGLQVRIQRLAFLFTDLVGSTALYERLGEAAAFRLVQEHFGILYEAIAAHRGAVVKTIGDAVMGVFPTALDALEAGIAIQHAICALDEREAVDPTRLVRVGVHAGPCVAVTLNGRLDYFGTTVNLAARIEHESRGGEIVASAAVYHDREVAERRLPLPVRVEPFVARLQGITAPVQLYRLIPCRDRAAQPQEGAASPFPDGGPDAAPAAS